MRPSRSLEAARAAAPARSCAPPAAGARREHWLDACRALLMFLGIPFHAALVYDARATWLVSAPTPSIPLAWLDLALHSFRMPAFFVVAGYFSLALVRRGEAGAWLRRRLVRLGVPLVTGAILLSPVQLFLEHYWKAAGAAAPAREAWAASLEHLAAPGAHWVYHLWFLVDLLLLSAAFALAWRLGRDRLLGGARWLALRVAAHPRRTALVALPLLALFRLAALGSNALLGEHRLVYLGFLDVHRVVSHAPYFALGAVFASHAPALRTFASPSRAGGLAAACSVLAYVLAHDVGGPAGKMAVALLSSISGVLMAQVVFSAARRWFDRPHPAVALLVDSSFTVYLVHQPLIVALGVVLVPLGLPPAVGFSALVAATTALAIAAHRGVRGSPTLMLLLNGSLPRRSAAGSAAEAAPSAGR